jgi:hypothetical protein
MKVVVLDLTPGKLFQFFPLILKPDVLMDQVFRILYVRSERVMTIGGTHNPGDATNPERLVPKKKSME